MVLRCRGAHRRTCADARHALCHIARVRSPFTPPPRPALEGDLSAAVQAQASQ